MTVHRMLNPQAMRPPPGPWSNAIEIRPGARYLFTCGLVGARQDGTFEEGVEAQTTRIYENLKLLLADAGMDMGNVVKITTYMVDVREQPAVAKARKPYLGDHHPAMTLLGIGQLSNPALRLEVEAIAAKND